jgi:hypothetical protein
MPCDCVPHKEELKARINELVLAEEIAPDMNAERFAAGVLAGHVASLDFQHDFPNPGGTVKNLMQAAGADDAQLMNDTIINIFGFLDKRGCAD